MKIGGGKKAKRPFDHTPSRVMFQNHMKQNKPVYVWGEMSSEREFPQSYSVIAFFSVRVSAKSFLAYCFLFVLRGR